MPVSKRERDLQRWQRKGTTAQRGYAGPHQKLRAQWKPIVDAGDASCHAIICLMPTRWIAPGTRWHLGHTPDRSAWTGPEHERCNEADGARRGNQGRRQPKAKAQTGSKTASTIRAGLHTSRDW